MRSSAVLVLLWAVLLSNACIADCAQQVAGSGNNAAKTKAVGDTKRQVTCTPGRGAKCCSPEGVLLEKGTVCRRAASVCEEDQNCNGVDATCPPKQKADGTDCAYDPLEYWLIRKGIKPGTPQHPTSTSATPSKAPQDQHPTATNPTDSDDASTADHRKPPPCIGKCFLGRCTLDRSRSGCCSLQREEEAYVSQDSTYHPNKAVTQPVVSAAAVEGGEGAKGVTKTEGGEGATKTQEGAQAAALKGSRSGVYCWKGSDYRQADNDGY